MTLETFFEKFELFADAPNAVGKMRELVLQLAVRGKLAPQNPNEEPASKALETIIGGNGARQRDNDFENESSVDVPFTVPPSWEWVRFGDLVRIRTGKLDANAAVEGGPYPFFTCSKTPSTIASYSFDTSAVILAGNGDFNLKSYSGKFDAYQRTYVIEPRGWELGFCFWLISAQIKRITDNQRGSAIPYLRLGDIADPLVPFPPLAEQKRIVAKVDELMALCDRLEAQQQERETRHAALARASLARFADAPTPANLNLLFHKSYDIAPAELRKAILTLAVQGKLVPQDTNDESAEELIARIERELTPEQRQRQAAPLPPLLVDSMQYELPNGWTWARFRDIACIASNLVKPNDFLDLPHLAPDNIEKGNGVLLPCLTVREDKVISSNHRFYPGQIVYSKIRPNLAKVVVVDFDGLCSADMYPIDARIDAFYLQRYMLSESFLVQAIKTDTRVAMPKINQSELNAIAIPVPPLAEQRRIVAKADNLVALVDALETQLAAARATGTNLVAAAVAELTSSVKGEEVEA